MQYFRYICLLLLSLGFWTSARAARVTECVLTYPSVGPNGETLMLSGKISVPTRRKPKGLILLTHYTIGGNSEAPSQYTSIEAKAFRNDYVLVMPDYIGYGATVDRFPPYLHGELTARNCVDMLFAARSTIDSLRPGVYTDSIYIVGFSQGGATALWTLRLLEEQYADRVYVRGCLAGSGPYDVAATYDEAVAEQTVGMALTVPLLVMGTSEAYGLQLRKEDFFTPMLSEMFEPYIASKRYSVLTLFGRMSDRRLDRWLTPAGMDKSQPETRRFYLGLLRSSLVHYPIDTTSASPATLGSEIICPTWRPKAPVYVFHSTTDDLVTFRNAEHLRRCWSDLPNVTYDFGNYGGHLPSMYRFFNTAPKRLK